MREHKKVFDEGDAMKKETAITCPLCPDVFLEFDTDVDVFVCPECGTEISVAGENEWKD